MNFRQIFQYLSYMQYPLMLIALYYMIAPYFHGFAALKANPGLIFSHFNLGFLFMGLGISFASLQDTTKTQNKFSLQIWESPQKGKIAIILMSLMILLFLTCGLIGYVFSPQGGLKEMSVGAIVLSLGMFGFLKAAVEMFENHRKDKN